MPLAAYQQLLGELKGLKIGSLHAEHPGPSGEEELIYVPGSARRRSAFPLPGWGDAGPSDQCDQRSARTRAPDHDPLLLRGNDYEGDRTYPWCRGIPGLADTRLCRVAPSRPARRPQPPEELLRRHQRTTYF